MMKTNASKISFTVSFNALASIVLVAASLAACGPDSAVAESPDARPSPIVVDPAGRYTLRTSWTVALPHGVAAVLAQLSAATDGADDPSRFLLDHLIDCMEEGWTKSVARALAPYAAAYVNTRIGEVAPKLTAGLKSLARGLERVAAQFETVETLAIGADGRAQRTILAAQFDPAMHSSMQLAPITIETRATLEGDRLEIASHEVRLPHGAMIRAGFQVSVIPSVVPGASDLASALITLVDCDRLGAMVADRIGVGSSALYAQACRIGVTGAAAEIDERLAALEGVPLELAVSGVARGLDRDGDHKMDAIEAGTWVGSSSTAIFAGSVP